MNKTALSALALTLLVAAVPATAGWVDTVARALGLSKTPSAQKAAGDGLQTGDVMVVPLAGGAPRALTSGGGYRSPVFLPGGDLLALSGQDLVRIAPAGGAPSKLRALPGAVKLVGVDRARSDRVLLLVEGKDGRASLLASASLTGNALETLPHDPDSKDDRRLMSHLRGENREHEGVSLYLKPESKDTPGGAVEWTDVYAKAGDAPPVNLSRCDGVPCGQPSLWPDGKQVAYIRSAR